jgi:hypothetical protein
MRSRERALPSTTITTNQHWTPEQQLLFDLAFSLKKVTLPGFRRAVTEEDRARMADADQFARSKRWRPEGRASWLKPNGTCVHFLAFEEQLAAISIGERVYVVGNLSATASRALRKPVR